MIHLDSERLLPWRNNAMQVQPRRTRAILLAVLLSFILLMSQIMPNLQRRPSPQLSYSDFEALEDMNGDVELPSCVKSYLGKQTPSAKPPITCQHLPPPRGFCSVLQDLYFSKHPPSCKRTDRISFCNRENNILTCKLPSQCEGSHLYLGRIGEGMLIWDQVTGALQSSVEGALNYDSFRGFLLITCSNISDIHAFEESRVNLESDFIQLFLTPRTYAKNSSASPKPKDHQLTFNKKPNLNLLMIDSLSRNHFYRSLLQTVNLMEELKESSTVTVLDFEYLQALKHSLPGNLNILFTGNVNFTHDDPHVFSQTNLLFPKYKNHGYHTLYLTDLCSRDYFGSPSTLNVTDKKTWSIYENVLRSSSIDAIDLAHLGCSLNDKASSNTLTCINGESFEKYLLDYLLLSQTEAKRAGQPLFTFLQTSIADEETGIRIQSYDQDLANYLKLSTELENTITILFSPRGIDRGSLIKKSPEGYIEKSNPFLFILIPKGASLLLGSSRMHLLKRNQQNLVSILDLYAALVDLVDHNKIEDKSLQRFTVNGGLFGDISPTRNCQDVPIVMPNLCICKNFDIPVPVSKLHHALADFGIGLLNNKILSQRMKMKKRGFGNCQMLQIMRIRNVHEMRIAADFVQHKLEVEVSGILTSGKDRELFFLVIESGSVYASLELVFYQRVNLYGSYVPCQDEEVDIDICVCDLFSEDEKQLLPIIGYIEFFPKLLSELFFDGDPDAKKNFSFRQIISFIKYKSDHMNVSLEKESSSLPSCAQIVHHDFNVGFTVFVANLCHYKIKVKLKIKFINLYLSNKPISSHTLNPLDLKLLVSGIKANIDAKHHWEYKLQMI